MTTFLVDIVPFQEHHQPYIDMLMAMIEKEFAYPISTPKSKTIKELPQLPDKYWVALAKSKVVGTIGLSALRNDSTVLKRMFLNKNFRGQGIAESLLNTTIKWANDNKFNYIYLGTMTQFKAAQKFYEKHSFKKISQTDLPSDFPLNPLDTLFYKRDLK